MKIVLITGAYGFLGRNIAREYKSKGNYYVIGLGHGKWYRDEFLKWGIDEWFETTITLEALLNVGKKFDVIVHCGGGGSVAFSRVHPYEDFQKTVQSTLSILEFIRLSNPGCKFIYPSSPAAQGSFGDFQIKENMSSSPLSPYGFHKKIAEDICFSYHKTYNITVGIVRFFSVYGNGLRKQLLWDACSKVAESEEVVFFGTGTETRDWIHVDDASRLLLLFSEGDFGFKIINGANGERITVKQVVTALSTHFDKPVQIKFNGIVKEGDPQHFWADISEALSLNWKPEIKLSDGLKNYVTFFKTGIE